VLILHEANPLKPSGAAWSGGGEPAKKARPSSGQGAGRRGRAGGRETLFFFFPAGFWSGATGPRRCTPSTESRGDAVRGGMARRARRQGSWSCGGRGLRRARCAGFGSTPSPQSRSALRNAPRASSPTLGPGFVFWGTAGARFHTLTRAGSAYGDGAWLALGSCQAACVRAQLFLGGIAHRDAWRTSACQPRTVERLRRGSCSLRLLHGWAAFATRKTPQSHYKRDGR